MAAITSRTFTVKLSKCSEPRAARRVIFNSDVLKVTKLSTGELVVLSGGVGSSNGVEAVGPMLWIPPFLLIEHPIEICCWDRLAISGHPSRRCVFSLSHMILF
jgi:hypothetical protein